jgi:putative transposase
MGLPRSTFYAAPEGKATDDEIVAQIRAITDAFECYGYRRVGAELRHRGHVVNAKKVRRLMRQHGLNPRRRRRFTRTTDSDHDGPIFPFVARDFEVHGPDQLWVADLTYVATATGFVYVAVILDAWSRRVVGYAIGRSLVPGTPSPRSKGRWRCAGRCPAACSTPTAARSTRPRSTARSSIVTASSAR